MAVEAHGIDVERAALSREDGEGGVDAVERVFEGEAAMRGDDGVQIGEQIVEKVQIDEMGESGKTGQRGTQQRRITA